MNQRISIFSSGNGTNCENIIRYFRNHPFITVPLVATNNPKAGVIERAKMLKVDWYIISLQTNSEIQLVIDLLKHYSIDWIILAGFLKKIPIQIISLFKQKIINIHPALLPKFGGKGMYGINVHRAVIEAGEQISGITIHYVNEEYDKGDIIAQYTTEVFKSDTPESLMQRIQQLEHKYYPPIIEQAIMQNLSK